MKLLIWIFSIFSRHFRLINRYEKGGIGRRVYIMILTLVLAGISLGLSYYVVESLFRNKESRNVAIGILLGILAVCFILSTLELCFVLSVTAFRIAITGQALTNKKRSSILANKKYYDDPAYQLSEEDKKHLLRFRAFDIVIGIYQLVIMVALIAGIAIIIL